MSSENEIECCFRGCFESSIQPDLRIEIFHTESGSSLYHAHKKCFNARKDPSVIHDRPEDHGTIPKGARCLFCGMELPVKGKHAYCFDTGNFTPPHRYWAHNECMKASLKIGQGSKLPF